MWVAFAEDPSCAQRITGISAAIDDAVHLSRRVTVGVGQEVRQLFLDAGIVLIRHQIAGRECAGQFDRGFRGLGGENYLGFWVGGRCILTFYFLRKRKQSKRNQ